MTSQPAAGFAISHIGGSAGRQDAEVDTGAHVARWRRYGKDRLYVTAAADGTKIGWRDLLTGEDHLDAPAREPDYVAALATWLSGAVSPLPAADASSPCPPEAPQSQPEVSQDSQPSLDWEDLAEHRPGTLAREQALALKQAAPVRTFLARALGVHTDERAWRVGANGEELVAGQLHRLVSKDARWRFLHAIPVGGRGSDIDHLVVGPGGVFTLNAKHHPRGNVWVRGDTFMVNGQRLPYIRNSRHEAARASRLLTKACGFPVAVHGVVVPVGAARLSIRDAAGDVSVVNRMALRRWLNRRPIVLAATQAAAIYEAARRSTTWRA